MYIVTIDIEKCQACGDCIENCAVGALEMVEEEGKKFAQFTADTDECIGCLSCESSCPEGAVTVTEY